MLLSIFIYTYKDYINKITIISTRLRLYQQDYDYINKITIISTRLRLYQQDYDYINKITIISTRLRLYQQDYDYINKITITTLQLINFTHYNYSITILDYRHLIIITELQVVDDIVIILQLSSYR